MAAGKYNIKIEQGSTFNLPMTYYTDSTQTTTIDFTGYTWRMQIRSYLQADTVLTELTSENGGIDIDNQSNGLIILKITAADTTLLDFSDAVYDLESVNGITVDRRTYGSVTLSKEVTR